MHENQPLITQNLDPTLPGPNEINMRRELETLRGALAIDTVDLFGARKMEDDSHPARNGVRVVLSNPMETAISSRSNIEQNLMAVISLGQDVGVGVVRAHDKDGNAITYLSLLNNNPTDNSGRAWLMDKLSDGQPITITRSWIDDIVGRKGAATAVSAKHCTVELTDGVLSVIDENSTNGTSVFTNKTQNDTNLFPRVQDWSHSSPNVQTLIEHDQLQKSLSRAEKLGRFTLDQ